MPEFNTMQAQMGLMPDVSSPIRMPTPSSAETSLQLMQQASQRQEASRQAVISASVGEQYRRQLAQIQSQQAWNPYSAQMMSGYLPGAQGYNQGYMPSPLMMTPPSTGVFRPPAPPATAPVSPMYRPPIPFTAFQPRLPEPMFQTSYEQQAQLSDMRANQMFAYASQAPGVAAQGLGLAAGAYAGARLGARFGRFGRVAGAIGGAAAAGFSGIAGGLRDVAQGLMRPAIETRQLGAGIQNLTRSWVVSGPQLHAMGRGMTRESSIQMAEELRNLSGEESFQEQTGEMFNRQDLMQILGQGGRSGLFDMAQSVPQIRQQLRETAVTIKQFMELTNNPDVSSVIRDMARLRQFGMTQQEMVEAAQGMKAYARAAGTTISGVQQLGGLPGAMTFQQAGLTAGTGFRYGNFAAASARQLVAAGGINERQLALLGGVQGMTQRDIQAQAAFSSMPMFAAMNAQFGRGGWGVNPAMQGQAGQGAFGMVQGSLQALNQAVRRGGIGALARFPLEQRRIADEATAAMTPEQQMAQRFEMAMMTGRRLGLRGEGAFAAGARTIFGDEVSEQMMVQARSPEFWRAQQQQIRRRQREAAFETRRQMMEDAPALAGIPRDIARGIGLTGRGSWGRAVGDVAGDIGEGVSATGTAISDLFGGVGDWWTDRTDYLESGVMRRRRGRAAGAVATGLREGARGDWQRFAREPDRGRDRMAKSSVFAGVSDEALVQAQNQIDRGWTGRGVQIADVAIEAAVTGATFGLVDYESDFGRTAAAAGIKWTTDVTDQLKMVREDMDRASDALEVIDRAKKFGGERRRVRGVSKSLEKVMGASGKGMGRTVLRLAADKIDKEVYDRGGEGNYIGDKERKEALKAAIQETTGAGPAEADAMVAELYKDRAAVQEFESQSTHFAQRDSRDKSTWATAQEGNLRRARWKQISKVTEAREESFEEEIGGLEDVLDVDAFLGVYSGEETEIQRMAAEKGGRRFAATAAYARAFMGDAEDRDAEAWIRLQREQGISEEEQERIEKELQGMEEGTVERLAEMAGRGTPEQMQRYAEALQQRGLQSAFAGRQFLERLGPYSRRLEGFVAAGDKQLTAQSVAEQFTEEELTRMERGGDRFAKQFAGTLRKAKKGDQRSLALIRQFAAEQQEVSGEGVEEAQAVRAGGEEARRLAASEEAVENMAAMFKDFQPAAKEFKEGAEMLRDAMEAGQIMITRDD